MPEYTVTEVFDAGQPWSTKDGKGPFIPYRFKVDGETRTVEWSRKPESPGPAVGDTVNGELVPNGDFPMKFKKAASTTFQSGGGKWQPPKPEEIAAMRRSGAGNRAVELLKVAHDMKLLEGKVTNRDQLLAVLSFFIDFFDGDVKAAADAAREAA